MIKVVTLYWVNNIPRAGQVASDRSSALAAIARCMRAAACAIVLLLTINLCGCANTEITAAQAELTKGNYAAAHEKFVAASHSPKLTAGERRELATAAPVDPDAHRRGADSDAEHLSHTGRDHPICGLRDNQIRSRDDADQPAHDGAHLQRGPRHDHQRHQDTGAGHELGNFLGTEVIGIIQYISVPVA